ncbi:VWA domain-containing protein [Kangiella sp. TOML190]|uniref:vWA domain-containing protein n=1 Tax=Kangiella sp. TOML190 TaxID=2931351 RepID=UPI00203BFA8F|nr:VWA domain-containing protein [Kangiella sp. TOML190]
MLELVWPWVWIVTPLPLLVWWLSRKKEQQNALKAPLYLQWQQFNQEHQQSSFNFPWLMFIIWLLLVLALSRPQWVGDPVRLPASGRDLMVSIDVSGSMEMKDMVIERQQVNRLIAVKHILNDFIERRRGDRIGLILFGEQAYLQTPLSFDLTTVQIMLNESEIGLAGPSATAIGDSIGLAVKRLKDRDAKNRVLILLTDGVKNAGILRPIQAAQLAAHAGVTIYTIGIGADEVITNNGLFRRKFNPSRELDEATLTRVAEATGGRYFRARDSQQLEQIYQIIDQLEPVEDAKETYRPTKALFFLPLFMALVLSFITKLAATVLQHRRRRQREKSFAKANEQGSTPFQETIDV